MKLIRFFIFTLFVLPALFQISIAQQTNSVITGIVIDTDGIPVEHATVTLLASDSVFVKGDITGEQGLYTIRSVSPGVYLIEVRNVAYNPHLSGPITIEAGRIIELEPVVLTPAVSELGEIQVVAERPVIEVHPDKVVFNVGASAAAAGRDGLQLLEHAPGVLIDPDDNILLQGRSGVSVYIDGRPSRLSGDDLTAMLQSLHSNDIESVEIITNPSARYDAGGSAGIINIVLKRDVMAGFNGTLRSGYSQGLYGRTSHGLSMNYQQGRLQAYGNLTGFINNFQDDFIDTRIQNNLVLDQTSLGLNRRDGLNLRGGMIYDYNDRHSLSFNGFIVVNDRVEFNEAITPVFRENDRTLLRILDSESDNQIRSINSLVGANYRYNPSDQTLLEFDFSYSDFDRSRSTDQPNILFEPDGTTVLNRNDNIITTDTEIELWAGQGDIEHRFEQLTLSAGGKFISIEADNDFGIYGIDNGEKIRDNNRSNQFLYREQVAAAYTMVRLPAGELFSLNAGIRAEHTFSEGNLMAEQEAGNSNVTRRFTDIFPSAGISFNSGNSTRLGLSLGRRINRPNYQSINPFEDKLSEVMFAKGNPFLEPEYTMMYQLNYSFWNRLTGSVGHSVTRNFIASIFEIVDTEKTVLVPQNMDRSIISSFNINYPLSFIRNWDMIGSLNLNQERFQGDFPEANININTITYDFRLHNRISLPRNFRFEMTYSLFSPFVWRGSVDVDGFWRMDAGLRKTFLGNRLQMNLTASDFLNTGSDFFYGGRYGGIELDGVRSQDNFRFGITLTWRFGNRDLESADRRPGALRDETGRLSDEEKN